jgi:hypothetical protein
MIAVKMMSFWFLPFCLFTTVILPESSNASNMNTFDQGAMQKRSFAEIIFMKRAGNDPEQGSNEKGRGRKQLTVKKDSGNLKQMAGHALKRVGDFVSCKSGMSCNSPQPRPHSLAAQLSIKQSRETPNTTPLHPSSSSENKSFSLFQGKQSLHVKKPSFSTSASMDENALKVAKGIFAPKKGKQKIGGPPEKLKEVQARETVNGPPRSNSGSKGSISPSSEHRVRSPKRLDKNLSIDDHAIKMASIFAPEGSTSPSSFRATKPKPLRSQKH